MATQEQWYWEVVCETENGPTTVREGGPCQRRSSAVYSARRAQRRYGGSEILITLGRNAKPAPASATIPKA